MRKENVKYEQRAVVSDELTGHHARFLSELNQLLAKGWYSVEGSTYGVNTNYGVKWFTIVEKEYNLSSPESKLEQEDEK